MSEVEIWFETAPAPAAVGLALEAFGEVVELRDGGLRLVEAGEAPRDGVELLVLEDMTAPAAVVRVLGRARAAIRVAVLATGGRAFWLAQLAAELQRRLGGVVFVPSSGAAFADATAFEASQPGACDHA